MMTAFTGVACNLERRNFPNSCQHRDLDALSGTEEFCPIHINIAIWMPCSGRRDFASWLPETDLDRSTHYPALQHWNFYRSVEKKRLNKCWSLLHLQNHEISIYFGDPPESDCASVIADTPNYTLHVPCKIFCKIIRIAYISAICWTQIMLVLSLYSGIFFIQNCTMF
jgi:hypothetical protein